MFNIDLGLFRRFPIGSKVNLELRAEAFNLTNTPHFNNPNGSVNSGGFMTITGDQRQRTGASDSGSELASASSLTPGYTAADAGPVPHPPFFFLQ